MNRLCLSEAVIPGLAPAPSIFAPPEQNIFLWHFMFNQLQDLPEALITGREAQYLRFMFEKWAVRLDRVAVDTYVQAYSAPGACVAGLPTTARYPKRFARTSSAGRCHWACRCWRSGRNWQPMMRRG
ncbi:hypothetical protein NWF32_01165 [Pseudomonas qingdaonensis]|nr:hypothetical protein [Pseudomonas qingdaonensis]